MNKRNTSLIILLAVMLASVLILCACMVQETPDPSTSVPTTENTDQGVDTWPEDATDAVTDATLNGEVDSQPTTEPETDLQETKPTDPKETTEATVPSNPPDANTKPTKPEEDFAPGSLSYQQFMALTEEQQKAYALSFPSVMDYIEWFNTEKEKVENDNVVEITGPVDLGDYTGTQE